MTDQRKSKVGWGAAIVGIPASVLITWAVRAGGLESTVASHGEVLREIAPAVQNLRIQTAAQFARIEAQYAEILRRLDHYNEDTRQTKTASR